MAGADKKLPVANGGDTIKVVINEKKKEGKKEGIIKLKKPAPKLNKAGNWREGTVIDDDKKPGTGSPSTDSPGPVVNQLDESAKESFKTGRPLEDAVELQTCRHCKKSVLKNVAKTHVSKCLKIKRDKQQKKKEAKEQRDRERRQEADKDRKDDDGDTRMDDDDSGDDASPEKKGVGGIKSAKKSAGKNVGADLGKGKKRKADRDTEKGPKLKKKKEEPKPKAMKPKGPVDVEKQCGVLVKEGVQCARSLTCKSHSMGAKRAVGGRSLPYDILLAAYQKKNQAKQQKAAIDANAPLEDEDAALGPVDSDEELTSVIQGLSNWNPRPLVPPIIHQPIDREYQKQRLYEQLHNATNGFTVNICKVQGYGYQKLPPGHQALEVDVEASVASEGPSTGIENVAARRATTFNMQLPPGRRASSNIQR